ncbi:MAG TPA: AraC family transcriptional regulator [Polyangiaceae bacterium]
MSSGANFTHPAETAALPGAYAYEIVALCARWGVDAEALLAGTGLTLDALKDPATRVPLDTCADIAERARTLTGIPGLAFLVGSRMRLSWHGFLGFAAMAAGTVREALAIAEQFSLTRTSAFSISTHVEGPVASVVFEERAPLGRMREFAIILLLVGVGRLADEVTGKSLAGVAECAFPEPDYAAPILAQVSSLPGGTMRFGQPAHRLVFDASILDLPLVNADPAAMRLARAQCDRELAALAASTGFVGRVRGEVARGDDGGFASLPEVARRVGTSTRTLKRRLAEQRTTFSEVLEEARRQRALLLLDDRRVPIAEVADRLGYSDVSNFTRAFRRWTGRTPAAFRTRP